jgi:uncharacterized protein
VSPGLLAIAFAVMFVGAAVQGVAGFGAGLLAAPMLVILDPALVPGPLIVTGVGLNLLVLMSNKGERPWRLLKWANVGQVFGAMAAAALLGSLPADQLALTFSVIILAAVALSATGFAPRRSPINMGVAGLTSGFMGTAVGIGGPPIALMHTGSAAEELRAALSRFFLLGTTFSIVALTVVGRFGMRDAGAGLLLMPGVLVGYAVARRITHRVNRDHLRVLVLVLSGTSAVVALLRALF